MKISLSIGLLILALSWTLFSRGLFLPITFFSVDEAVSAVAAETILDGGLPYRDAIDHRGPLTYYFYAFVFLIFGHGNMVAIHSIYIVLILLSTLLVFKIGSYLHSSTLGGWAALMFAVWGWLNPFHEMWAAHTEWLLVFFSLMGIWLLLRYSSINDSLPKEIHFWLAGLIMGIGILSKQTAVFDLAGIGLFFWILSFNKEWKLISVIRKGIFMGLGAILPLISVCLYFWINGAWEEFSFYVWEYNTKWYVPAVPLGIRMLNAIKLLGGFFINKPLLILLLVGAVIWRNKGTHQHSFSKVFLFGIVWALAAGTGALLGGRAFLHYLIPVLAPTSLLAAIPLTFLSQKTIEESIPFLQKTWKPLLMIGILVPIFIHFWQNGHLISRDHSITEFEAFSEYIQAESQPDDQIFVWGFAPELYVLTHRKPASRYSFCNMLSGHIPAATEKSAQTKSLIVPGSWETLMRELKNNRPYFFIDTQPGDYRAYGKYPVKKYPQLNQWLQKGYRKDQRFHQQHPEAIFHLYRRILP